MRHHALRDHIYQPHFLHQVPPSLENDFCFLYEAWRGETLAGVKLPSILGSPHLQFLRSQNWSKVGTFCMPSILQLRLAANQTCGTDESNVSRIIFYALTKVPLRNPGEPYSNEVQTHFYPSMGLGSRRPPVLDCEHQLRSMTPVTFYMKVDTSILCLHAGSINIHCA
jgi:hypothetical protein